MIAQNTLKRFFKVVTCDNGAEAIRVCRTREIDLLLLDIQMPHLTGFEVLNRLKSDEMANDIPVVMFTSDCRMDTVQKVLSMGAQGFISKPVQPDSLFEKVSQYMKKLPLPKGLKIENAARLDDEDFGDPQEKHESVLKTHADKGIVLAVNRIPEASISADAEIQEVSKSIDQKLSKCESVQEGFTLLHKYAVQFSNIDRCTLFVHEGEDDHYRAAVVSGLNEEDAYEVYHEHQSDILRNLSLTKEGYFRFRDKRSGGQWLAYSLRIADGLPGFLLFVDSDDSFKPSSKLQIFLTMASLLLGCLQKRVASEHGFTEMAKAFSASLDAKDPYTRGHTEGVTLYALSINTMAEKHLKEYHIPENNLRLAGQLHDIGKIAIPDRILGKPDKLTDEEFELMKTHTNAGLHMLSNIARP